MSRRKGLSTRSVQASATASRTAASKTGGVPAAAPAAAPKKPRGRKTRSGKQVVEGVLNRQSIKTGSVDAVRALLPSQPLSAEPVHGDDIVLDESDKQWRKQGPGRVIPVYKDSDVVNAIRFIAKTGLLVFLTPRMNADKAKDGAPGRLNLQALFVAMWLAARDNRPMLLRQFRDTLAYGITSEMRAVLNIPTFTPPDEVFEDPQAMRIWDEAAEASLGRLFHRMLKPIDPSIYPKNRKMTWPVLEKNARALTLEEQIQLQINLDFVCNQILHATWLALPRAIRRQYRKADMCVDATPMELPATGPSSASENTSSDPDGGHYVREGCHLDPLLKAEQDWRDRTGLPKHMWALDIHLLVSVDARPGKRQHIPALALAMTTDRPGVDPAGNTRRLFASVLERGFKPGWLGGDRLYSAAEASTFQIPARENGWSLVLPYTADQLGTDKETHPSGALLVEGTYVCPAMPQPLIDATKDLADGRITLPIYAVRRDERDQYALRTKELPDSNGNGERLACPAAGSAPTVKCPLKPDSEKPRPTLQANGTVTDARLTVIPNHGQHKPPQVCKQKSISIKSTDGAKTRQDLPYGSDEQVDTLNILRQSQEGVHGNAKDSAHQALGAPGRRRVRGKAAQSLFAAFLLAAANMSKIHTFLANAIEDPLTDAIYVMRKERTGDHARTGLPGGLKPPPGFKRSGATVRPIVAPKPRPAPTLPAHVPTWPPQVDPPDIKP